MKEVEDFLKEVGIDLEGQLTDDDVYIINIDDSNVYSQVFSKIDNSTLIHEIEDDSVFDIDNNVLYFEAENYDIELDADLENDEYQLRVSKRIDD